MGQRHNKNIRVELGVASDQSPIARPRFTNNEQISAAIKLTIATYLALLSNNRVLHDDCACVLSRPNLCEAIELRPNALASPQTARLTNDIHP